MRRFPISVMYLFGAVAVMLFVSACPKGSARPSKPGELQSSGACINRDLKPTWVQQRVGPNIVRIITDANTSGTGFLLTPPNGSGDPILVTNLHVVAAAMHIEAEMQSSSGEWVRVSNIEVVKADPQNDLVLMKAPWINTRAGGLRLSRERIVLGQEIGLLGFPGVVHSDFALTVATGIISAVRNVDGQEYLVTDAAINPGNSGGPMVNACGDVVGVVVAKVTSTERTGLVIQAGRLAELDRAYRLPRRDDETEIRERFNAFMMALVYRQQVEAAAFMSRMFLLREIAPAFLKDVESCVYLIDEEAHKTGRHVETLSLEELGPICEKTLSEHGRMVVTLKLLLENGQINRFQALQVYFSAFVSALFGQVSEYRIDLMRRNPDGSYEVRATVLAGGAATHWMFELRYEWGNWSIENIQSM